MIRRPVVSHTPLPAVILVGLFLSATAMNAQLPKRDQPPKPREGTGVIRGRVTRADTGEPLRRAQVRVEEWSTDNPMGPAATMTDAEGRYELTQLPAGRYQLKASRGGYVEVAYGQRRPFERGRRWSSAKAPCSRTSTSRCRQAAVVTGRVVDEAGEAVVSVSVSLSRPRYIDGARRLVDAERQLHGRPRRVQDFRRAARRLRDRREVPRDGPRLERSYPVRADLLSRHAARERGTAGHGRRWPGGARDHDRARPRGDGDIRGVVRGSGHASIRPIHVRERSRDRRPGGLWPSAMAIGRGDGSFAIAGLLPGTYWSRRTHVRVGVRVDGGRRRWLRRGGVTLLLSKGATVRGRIRFDTGDPPKGFARLRSFVMPTFVDQIRMADMSGRSAPVTRDDWTFELQGSEAVASSALAHWAIGI